MFILDYVAKNYVEGEHEYGLTDAKHSCQNALDPFGNPSSLEGDAFQATLLSIYDKDIIREDCTI